PASARVAVVVGAETPAPALVLSRGVSISGRVTRTDSAGSVIIALEAQPELGGASERWVGGRFIAASDGNLAKAMNRVLTARDGTYSFSGLTPGSYRVSLESLFDLHPSVTDDLSRIVIAPAEGVDFILSVAQLAVHVSCSGRPAPDAEVTFERSGL